MSTNDAARARLVTLLDDPAAHADSTAEVVDLLGPAQQAGPPTGIGQRLMNVGAVSAIYERYWRPALGMVAKGIIGPSMGREIRLARELLRLRAGNTVLDVACGTGAFTRAFGNTVGSAGLAVGLDGSPTMLREAVEATEPSEPVAFIRADAVELPFAPATMDAVCCFAALHLFADADRALDSFRATLKPGGRLAILTSAKHGWQPARALEAAVGAGSGMRMFERGEIADNLRERGFTEITTNFAGVTQLVAATRP